MTIVSTGPPTTAGARVAVRDGTIVEVCAASGPAPTVAVAGAWVANTAAVPGVGSLTVTVAGRAVAVGMAVGGTTVAAAGRTAVDAGAGALVGVAGTSVETGAATGCGIAF
jgi:hypothetical protein